MYVDNYFNLQINASRGEKQTDQYKVCAYPYFIYFLSFPRRGSAVTRVSPVMHHRGVRLIMYRGYGIYANVCINSHRARFPKNRVRRLGGFSRSLPSGILNKLFCRITRFASIRTRVLRFSRASTGVSGAHAWCKRASDRAKDPHR